MDNTNTDTTWRLSKSITWGHILSTLAMGISLFFWFSSMDKRIEQNTQAITYLKEGQQKEPHCLAVDLRSMNTKLDRLLESCNQR